MHLSSFEQCATDVSLTTTTAATYQRLICLHFIFLKNPLYPSYPLIYLHIESYIKLQIFGSRRKNVLILNYAFIPFRLCTTHVRPKASSFLIFSGIISLNFISLTTCLLNSYPIKYLYKKFYIKSRQRAKSTDSESCIFPPLDFFNTFKSHNNNSLDTSAFNYLHFKSLIMYFCPSPPLNIKFATVLYSLSSL